MLFDDTYLTIAAPVEGLYRVSGSKFVAYAFTVNTEAEIKPTLNKVKALHPSASHHCWAVKLGSDQSAHRFNDDGEPAGSAGRPILNTILSKRLSNVMVIVVRYFGGTLLGIPGLISAYKAATEDALLRAKIVEKTFNDFYKLEFGYLQMNEVMKLVKDHDLAIVEQNFDTACSLTFGIRKTQVDMVTQKLNRLSDIKLTYVYSN